MPVEISCFSNQNTTQTQAKSKIQARKKVARLETFRYSRYTHTRTHTAHKTTLQTFFNAAQVLWMLGEGQGGNDMHMTHRGRKMIHKGVELEKNQRKRGNMTFLRAAS